jgi:hypothetical protein
MAVFSHKADSQQGWSERRGRIDVNYHKNRDRGMDRGE